MRNLFLLFFILASMGDATAGKLALEIRMKTIEIVTDAYREMRTSEMSITQYKYRMRMPQPLDSLKIRSNDEVFVQVRFKPRGIHYYITAWTKSGNCIAYSVIEFRQLFKSKTPEKIVESLVWGDGNPCSFMPVPELYAEMAINGNDGTAVVCGLYRYDLMNIKYTIRKGKISDIQVFRSEFPVPFEIIRKTPRKKRGSGPVRREYYETIPSRLI